MTDAQTRRATHEVAVGPFRVLDRDRSGTVERIVDLTLTTGRHRPVSAFALHVEGLNRRDDSAFVRAMRTADVVYADGGSVVWLARRAGAASIERAPTTDIGWDVLGLLGECLGRPPRVACVGGEPGRARVAASALDAAGAAEPVLVQHGFHRDWRAHVARLAAAEPEVVLVGMGVPTEMLWVERWRHLLPPSLVMTCGGWFGFLAGEEQRAPVLLRRPGFEWIARVAQAPSRLGPRYLKGAVSTARMARTPGTTASTVPAQRSPA